MAIPAAGKTFGPYKFLGSDADSSDTTYSNDTWTFSNLSSLRDGPADSGEDMDYAPPGENNLMVYHNGVLLRGGGEDYTFTAGSNGDLFAAKVVFNFEIDDNDHIIFDLRGDV